MNIIKDTPKDIVEILKGKERTIRILTTPISQPFNWINELYKDFKNQKQ
jgi:hypothetical protein